MLGYWILSFKVIPFLCRSDYLKLDSSYTYIDVFLWEGILLLHEKSMFYLLFRSSVFLYRLFL